MKMKIAVIGAGSAGLAALRNCTVNNNIDVTCYEKTDQVGGTWVFVEETGKDRYGLPIHSSMYKSLRTNLPKEVMGYPDFQIPENEKSYLTRTEILKFLNDYCDHFNLRDKIQFLHNVEKISLSTNNEETIKGKWKIQIRDLEKNLVKENFFDAVMVCNGHYFEPSLPTIKGMETFKGEKIHSHDYRVPDTFTDKKVVVIGAGPSGMDLALEISHKAKHVYLSHHLKDPILTKFPANVEQRMDIKEIKNNTIIFQDGSQADVDILFYCTGYKYSFPFLDDSCGVKVDSNMVTPLWKHIISIENPTLAIIGLPYYVCAFSMFDLQVRFVLKYWLKEKELPSKEIMRADENKEIEERKMRGFSKRQFHMMGPLQGDYYNDLAVTAGINGLPPVLTKLHNDSSNRFLDDLVHYREDRYKIIDDENFVQIK